MSRHTSIRMTDEEADCLEIIGKSASESFHEMMVEIMKRETILADKRMKKLIKEIEQISQEKERINKMYSDKIEEINRVKTICEKIDQKRISIKVDLESKKKELFDYLQFATDQWKNLRMDYTHKLAMLKSRVKIFNQENNTKFDPEESAKEMLDSIGMNKLF